MSIGQATKEIGISHSTLTRYIRREKRMIEPIAKDEARGFGYFSTKLGGLCEVYTFEA